MNKNTAAAVRAAHVKKSYRDDAQEVQVLKDVSLEVLPGEVVAILGSSGSGKSTLLHALAGLDEIDSGEVSIAGVSLAGLSAKEKGRLRNERLGFVYQFHHLLPEFSALDNAAMPLLIGRQDMKTARERARRMLEAVGLGERLSHLPSQLSGGERQRVAVARALAASPSCVLADEPTGNLDAETARNVFALFLKLAREEGTAVLIVTHDRELAGMCDRALELRDGMIRDA